MDQRVWTTPSCTRSYIFLLIWVCSKLNESRSYCFLVLFFFYFIHLLIYRWMIEVDGVIGLGCKGGRNGIISKTLVLVWGGGGGWLC